MTEKGNKEECLANAEVVSILAKKFGIGQWSFIGPGSEKKWYSMEENSPQGIWDHIADEMLLEFAERCCPIFRATTPLSRSKLKCKGHGKLSIHFAADQETIETIFRIIVFANQLSHYGAVANMCEEYESLHDRSGNRLISYIHHTCEYKQYCYVGNTAKQCRLGLFQDSDFTGYLEDSTSASGGTLCVFWKSYICSNELDV